jgi:hypothetical protein
MPDENRVVAAIMDLTKQVSRAAWALEAVAISKSDGEDFEDDPCRCCSSQLVPVLADVCPACLEPKKEKTDG